MNYNFIIIFFLSIVLLSCKQLPQSKNLNIDFQERYTNSGFALIYTSELNNIKKLEERSLNIFHQSLKKRSIVKISNPDNGKFLIAEVKSNKVKFSNFYNSILSKRIADELELNFDEPFVEIMLVSKNSTFVAKKAKMFEEERSVAEKAPVDGISINDLNTSQVKEKIDKKVKYDYIVKVADFYYLKSAQTMKKKIINETSIKKVSIKEISNNNFRVFLGPFNKVELIKKAFNDMNIINFENLEVIRNEKNI